MKNIRIYKTYALVFFKKAKLDKSLKNVLEDFHIFNDALAANKKLQRFLISNIYSFDEKMKVIKLCKMHETSLNMIELLVKNSQIKCLQDIYDKMVELKLADEGITKAVLVSSTDMNDKDIHNCQEVLEKKLSKKFTIDHEVDKSIIGGVVLKFGTMMYDASVKTALQRLKGLRV